MLLGRAYFLRKNLTLGRWVALRGFVVFAVFLKGVLGKLAFAGGVFVDSVW